MPRLTVRCHESQRSQVFELLKTEHNITWNTGDNIMDSACAGDHVIVFDSPVDGYAMGRTLMALDSRHIYMSEHVVDVRPFFRMPSR